MRSVRSIEIKQGELKLAFLCISVFQSFKLLEFQSSFLEQGKDMAGVLSDDACVALIP